MRPKLHIFGLFLAALLCAILLAACYDNAPTATPSGWNGTPPRYEVPTPSVATSITVLHRNLHLQIRQLHRPLPCLPLRTLLFQLL
jgi:hypothetical protein